MQISYGVNDFKAAMSAHHEYKHNGVGCATTAYYMLAADTINSAIKQAVKPPGANSYPTQLWLQQHNKLHA